MRTIDIVIPVFNDQASILDSVGSALAQRDCVVNCIVINDGSTDETDAVLRASHYFERITYISKSNGGVASARNEGLRRVRSEFVSFLDSDDILEVDFAISMISFLEKQNVNLAFCDHMLVELDGKTRVSTLANTRMPRVVSKEMMFARNYFMTPTVVFRASCAIGLQFSSSLRYNEDWVYWCQLAARGGAFHSVPGQWVRIRTRPTGLTSQTALLAPNYVRAIRNLEQQFCSKGNEFSSAIYLTWADTLRALKRPGMSLVYFGRALRRGAWSSRISIVMYILKFCGELIGTKKVGTAMGLIKSGRRSLV